MASTLAFLTQKIIHAKTGHVFLLYFTEEADGGCSIDLTIAGPEGDAENFDTRLLGRWWSSAWTEGDLEVSPTIARLWPYANTRLASRQRMSPQRSWQASSILEIGLN